ncbi:MAG: hypothetical protein QOE55_6206 [Acidobacteriaceae bacterium]|nr:hypothetical protein [Acidobacteriaceae bacterium]
MEGKGITPTIALSFENDPLPLTTLPFLSSRVLDGPVAHL